MNARPETSPSATVAASRTAHLVVQRTARYVVLGESETPARELWIALHGYGQLAADFARAMSPVAGEGRLVVVPEALSRFYLRSPVRGGAHLTAGVGATWMTREDRDAEIADQVAYLDALLAHARAELAPAAPVLRVLGFSQGVATLARWLARSDARPDHLVAWAGSWPEDVEPGWVLKDDGSTRVSHVVGAQEEILHPEWIEQTAARLSAATPRYERLSFDGGHRLDRRTLLALARTPLADGVP